MRLKSAPAPSAASASASAAPASPGPSKPPGARSAGPSPSPRPAPQPRTTKPSPNGSGQKPEQKILFQKFFKSVGPRTYAAQVKEAGNGNHFIVLTEGRRDEGSDEVRKTRLFIFGEDFSEFFKMLHEVAVFVRDHPVSDEVKERRRRFWNRKKAEAKG